MRQSGFASSVITEACSPYCTVAAIRASYHMTVKDLPKREHTLELYIADSSL